MIKRLVAGIKEVVIKYWLSLFIVGTAVYFVSCLFANFVIGKTWYNPDMYADAFVAELMADGKTLFPEGWTFGNQYYIIATPVLCSFFYQFIGNSFYAMALASSMMTVGIYTSYLWCFKPFVSRKPLFVGLFVLSGAMLFGTGACGYGYGFQLLYTMCSYYSCYVLDIFVTLGVFFRIYTHRRLSKWWIAVAVLMNFALGMQSLRQTLIFVIPFLLVSFLIFLKERQKRTLLFPISVLAGNGMGIIVIKILIKVMNVSTYKVITDLQFRTDPSQLWEKLKAELHNFYEITGLCFFDYIQWEKIFIIIFAGVLLSILSVIVAVLHILWKKNTSPLAMAISCCAISVFLVFVVGVFCFNNRPIYYFVWYILVVLSVSYFFSFGKKVRILKGFLLMCLLLTGLGNYYTNFYNDFMKHHDRNQFYHELTQEFLQKNIRYVYLGGIWNTDSSVYVYSGGNIRIGTVDFKKESMALVPLLSLKYDDNFKAENLKEAYIIFSESEINYMEIGQKEEFHQFLSTLEFVGEKKAQGKMERTVKIYKTEANVFSQESR